MGVAVSSTAAIAPFSLATGIIGLVSFAFTVGTFLKVVWANLDTMSASEHEVHSYLTNLRAELLEERASIRHLRREAKACRRRMAREQHPHENPNHRPPRHSSSSADLGPALDDVALKVMADYIRSLIKRFHHVERHFLAPGAEGIEGFKKAQGRPPPSRHRSRDRSVSPYYLHSAYASATAEKNGGGGGGKGGSRGRRRRSPSPNNHHHHSSPTPTPSPSPSRNPYWAQRTAYARFTLGRRFVWLTSKAEVTTLYNDLTRVQIRRIARQVGGLSLTMHENASAVRRIEERVERVDARVGRVMGVRRVE